MSTFLKKTNLAVLILLPIFIAVFVLRLSRITDIGVDGVDTFYYWQTALNWMEGAWSQGEHFRPFIYWLHSKVMLATGQNDWSIRTFNLLCDQFVGILLIYICIRLRKNWVLGLTVALTYFTLFNPLLAARSEIVHAPSSFFFIFSVLFFVKWLQHLDKSSLFTSAILLSCSWHIHPDLAVLGAGYVFMILFKILKSNKIGSDQKISNFLAYLIIFLVGYWSIFLVFSMKIGFSEMLEVLISNHSSQSSKKGWFILRFFQFFYAYLVQNLGIPLSVLFGLSVLTFGMKIKKGRASSVELFIFIMPVTYSFFCALLFPRVIIPRLFIPQCGLVILFISLQFFDLFRREKIRDSFFIFFSFSFLFFNQNTLYYPFQQPISPYKKISETILKVVSNEGNILIAPLSVIHIHSPLSQNVYLQGRGVYLISTKERHFEDIFKKHNIRYIWIADILQDNRVFGKNLKDSTEARLLSLYGLNPNEYSIEKEKKLLKEKMHDIQANLIFQHSIGEIYELKK